MKEIRTVFLISIVTMLFVANAIDSHAQNAKPRPSPKASVSQTIGVDTEITINYGRPGVKEREIWGNEEMVPYGMYKGNKYSNNKPYPWRAGANENTTIEFNNNLKIQDKEIPAGKYSIHMILLEDSVARKPSLFQIMFNKKNDAWGSYSYDADDNALVVKVKPVKSEHTEWLEYGFEELSNNGATAYLKWAELKIPIEIKLIQ